MLFTVCRIPLTVYPVSEHIGLPQSKAKLSKNGHYSDIIVKYSMWYYCKMTVHNIVEEKNFRHFSSHVKYHMTCRPCHLEISL